MTFEGYKSYICFGVCVAATVFMMLKSIDQQTWMAIMGIFAPLGGIALRAGSKTDASRAARAIMDECKPGDWGPQ